MQRNLFWVVVSLFLLLTGALGQSDIQAHSPGHVGFRVLYNVHGEAGGFPYGLARDRQGSLYGVTSVNGGAKGGGALFKLVRKGSGYTVKVLHDFVYSPAGDCVTTPVFDHEGNLFGVCEDGIAGGEGGALWEYSHEGEFSILHVFNGVPDGLYPEDAVALDDSGNIYGTTYTDGTGSGGTLWEYSRPSRTFAVLHSFTNGSDGGLLPTGPRLDRNRKLWGTTLSGPSCYYCGAGTVWSYDLASATFTTVLDFSSSSIISPQSRFALDGDGNLYGTAFGGSVGNCGLVYELEKSKDYAPSILYSFTGNNGDGCAPFGKVTLDEQGNLLGTTGEGGTSNWGTVYILNREPGGWKETILHSFSFQDGSSPLGGLVKVGQNWFGTTNSGGNSTGGVGVVFEISGVK